MEKLCFKVADLCFSIEAPSASMIKKLLPSYAPFYVAEGENSNSMLYVVVNNGVVDANAEGEELGQFDCGGTNHGVYRLAEGYKVVISTVEGHLASAMKTNADFSKCVISLFGDEDDQRFGLGNAMMIAFAFAAAYYNVVLMHASVTMNNGYGYLFLGKSGTGKSTQVANWLKNVEGCDLVNDDNPIIRVIDGAPVLFGSPWSGKTACYRNIKVPLGAVLKIQRDSTNHVEPLDPVNAFATLLSACSSIRSDEKVYNNTCGIVSRLIPMVTMATLHCLPDAESALVCRRFLEG